MSRGVRGRNAAMVSTCTSCGKHSGKPIAIGFTTTALPAGIVSGIGCGLLAKLSPWFLWAILPTWFIVTWMFWEGPRLIQTDSQSVPQMPALWSN